MRYSVQHAFTLGIQQQRQVADKVLILVTRCGLKWGFGFALSAVRAASFTPSDIMHITYIYSEGH